jgi:hypothetical protein
VEIAKEAEERSQEYFANYQEFMRYYIGKAQKLGDTYFKALEVPDCFS